MSGEFRFISCKRIFASVTILVNLENIFRNLDWWLRLQLSDVWETSTSTILSTALENAFLNCFELVTFSTELEDTFKWTLSKLLSALMSAPKEPSFSDIILKSTVLAADLDASSKNHYLYCKDNLPWSQSYLLVWICLCLLNEHHLPKDHW